MADATPDNAGNDFASAQTGAESAEVGDLADGRVGVEVVSNKGAPAEQSPAPLSEYTRNLLRITVPVTVTLASHRTPIHEIIELGPGSIVKFEKTCDQPLELNVGDRPIATGEVVKVGDKFGLRIGALFKSGAEEAPTEA